MHKKILALCLMTSLLANTGYGVVERVEQIEHKLCSSFSCSQDSARSAAFGCMLGTILTVAVPLMVVGTSSTLGNAWADSTPSCGGEKSLCIDSCTYGCRDTHNQTCEEFGESCENSCMLTIENYSFVGSVSVCPHNGCQGGSACIPQGQAVVPENLHSPRDQGTIWGRAMVAASLATVVVSAIFFMVVVFCYPKDEI